MDTPFGLAAYFYTRDLGRAWRVADALEAGMVGITRESFQLKSHRSAALNNRAWGVKVRDTGLEDYTELKYMMMSGLGS